MRKFLVHLTAKDHGYVPANMSQGDDTVEAVPDWVTNEQIIASASKRSVPISDVFRSKQVFSFCSQQIFVDGEGKFRVVPERPMKMLVNYFMNAKCGGRRSARNSLLTNMRHHPQAVPYLLACDTILPPL